jgi:peptide/nickel transport system substrate-binding protein
MYTNNPTTPIPVGYMLDWYAGPEDENIAQASNDWSGLNSSRYRNAEYDALLDAVRVETDLEAAAEMFIQMNDILINEIAVVPLVNRAASKHAISTTLEEQNVATSAFEYNYWNIANWNRKA